MASTAHPYYPVGQKLDGYLANTRNSLTLLSIFLGGCMSMLFTTYYLIIKLNPSMKTSDIWAVLWFAFCGCVHLLFEGYFAYNFKRMSGMTDIFGQLWKEYSLSDSRYQTQNAFVLCMETVTAFIWGPLSFLLVLLIIKDYPLRHPMQIIASLGQLYGDILYYATSSFDHCVLDIENSRPESLRFWGYFLACNAIWIVIPSVLLGSSLRASMRAFACLSSSQRRPRGLDICKD